MILKQYTDPVLGDVVISSNQNTLRMRATKDGVLVLDKEIKSALEAATLLTPAAPSVISGITIPGVASLSEQQMQSVLLEAIKANTTGLVKNDKEIPFVWFLVKQAFTDATVDDIVVSYAILNTETGEGASYTKRWRGWIDVTVPSPITDYVVPMGGMPLTLAQMQSLNLANAANQAALNALVGEVQANPTANTVLDRLKTLETALKSPQLESHTTASAASLIATTSAATLYNVSGYNEKATAQFIQVFDAATLPANGATPIKSFSVLPTATFSFDFAGTQGIAFSTGIVVCNSSTLNTKTIGAADCRFEVGYRNV